MRNLLNVGHKRAALLDASDLPPTATAWDTVTNSLITTFGPTEDSPIIELKRIRWKVVGELETAVGETITSWDAPCPLPDLPCDEVLSLHWFSDSSTACLVLAGGDLVIIRENPAADEDRIEIVGSVDVGISAAAWSPEQELLAIVTRSNTFLFMTKDFDSVNETTFRAEDTHASKHVSVGWGKKETQFQGKRAKALRDPTMPEHVDEGKLSPSDDHRTTISWRGDGAFVAVNSLVSGNRRLIRIFTREGVLDSASEPVDGLEGALSWRPAGNLMASVQRKVDSVDVVFFERNGLRHGQFSLRLSPEDMDTWARSIQLAWNSDSTVLAVNYADRIQLWTMGNYHYYLKQELILGERNLSFSTLQWHPERSLCLSLQEESYISSLEYAFNLNGGSTVQPHDNGTSAVIDGKILKLTPLKLAGVPPPMALSEVEVDESIIDTAINQKGSLIFILTRRGVYVYSWDLASRTISTPTRSKFCEHSIKGHDIALRQITATADDVYYILWNSGESGSHVGRAVPPAYEDFSDISASASLDASFSRITTDIAHEAAWIQSPHVLRRIASEGTNFQPTAGTGPNDLPWFSIMKTPEKTDFSGPVNGFEPYGNQQEVSKFGLSRSGELYANSRVLAKSCTSFVLTPAHLIFTTSNHLLKFVHITEVEDLDVPADTPEIDERCRAVERGAKLVTVTPSNYAVTLQMPRGNLETIYPRALVLAGIRQHIDKKDYKSAYLACRNHQVDTNILSDYQPDQFMSNVSLIVQQLKKQSRMDDFLSKLRDEDVTVTLYQDTLKLQPTNQTTGTIAVHSKRGHTTSISKWPAKGKTNRICDAFLSAFARDPAGRVQNMMTAHVSKHPPDLMAALQLVSKLRETSIEESDSAIVHLCFLSDVNRLYDVALSLYDIPLTLLVAEQSQRDPREYMPFLERLHALPQEYRRRFEIDDYLRNYPKAIASLYELGVHDELERYCIKHSLYTQALALYKHEPAPQMRFKALSHRFGEYLVSQSKNRQAAIIYESLLDYSSAYPLYALAHMWRESLACAAFVDMSDDQRRQTAISLASTLSEHDRDYRAAATIYVDHLRDSETAARLLCRGSYFGDATRVLALHGMREQIPTIVDPGLTEKFGEILELLADCKSQFSAQVSRIEELRIKKAEDPLAFFGGEATADVGMPGDVPDNVSIAPTSASTTGGQSLFTRYGSSKGAGTVASAMSRKTSKTRRKEERKRAMGKKGSVYEEEYLISSVGRCIERVNGALDEIRRLGEGLLRRGMRDRAEILEENVRAIINLSKDSSARVWPQERQDESTVENNEFAHIRPSGGEGVLWDAQQENSGAFKEAPAIREWKDLET